ncbi:hypothetical protein QNI19_38585 [Cytophagaceae bacterium DM2B3-1]|uniref:DUF3899 domain-containing protein n=1 Tax=Xanthocytophaga flava TaxID=3048013 RepID=A0ABT7CYP1_9BACT|nr:hypothetical protein [Xanthocytophaga flavus]MDJ1498899.1 hypothetical protein [Xanthocytophaga flavus]
MRLDHATIHRILSVIFLVLLALTGNYVIMYIFWPGQMIYLVLVIGLEQVALTREIKLHYPNLYKRYQVSLGSEGLQKIDLDFSKEDLASINEPELYTRIRQHKSDKVKMFTTAFLTFFGLVLISILKR